ncbi:MAG: Asp-tRNA(Asn)/Glu-tRNA(Gln) amidotransferase GatCAB subunit B, partial [Betaproteobacteria bacterium]|nr:Asp-tRNA(Asn)/Glu-tRNA(Gln) amidotransferase GatCAB subunit B [Betaproteobacteria bacterium]
DIAHSRVPPEALGWIVQQVSEGALTGKMAKQAFDGSWSTGEAPQLVVEKQGLKPITDAGAIDKLVDEVLAANAKQIADYRAGKEKAFNALVGQVMKASKGKANPAQVNEILRRKLAR